MVRGASNLSVHRSTCLPSASPAAEPAPDRTERVPPLTRAGFPQENPEQGLQRMGCWGKKLDQEGCCSGGLFGGVIDDYRRRLPQYGKDITQGITPKTLSSALFMFFATFFSTASLGALIQKATNKRIGLEEYLLMNAIAGMTHALFGCQASLNGVLDFISACVRPAALLFPRDLFQLTCSVLCVLDRSRSWCCVRPAPSPLSARCSVCTQTSSSSTSTNTSAPRSVLRSGLSSLEIRAATVLTACLRAVRTVMA